MVLIVTMSTGTTMQTDAHEIGLREGVTPLWERRVGGDIPAMNAVAPHLKGMGLRKQVQVRQLGPFAPYAGLDPEDLSLRPCRP